MANDISPFEADDGFNDWHAVYSIQLGELIECGFVDFSADDWQFDAYSDEQHNRLVSKIVERYRYREISVLPPLRWKQAFLRKVNEVMPKYKPLYAKLEAGQDITAEYDEYGGNRAVYSDFPATLLNTENQDYASNATDSMREIIRSGDWVDKANQIKNEYNDVDVMILDELRTLFSPLLTVNMNGW